MTLANLHTLLLIMSITCPIDDKRSDDEDIDIKTTRPHGQGHSNGRNILYPPLKEAEMRYEFKHLHR